MLWCSNQYDIHSIKFFLGFEVATGLDSRGSSFNSNQTDSSSSFSNVQADTYSYDYHKIFIRSDAGVYSTDSVINIRSFDLNAMFRGYWVLNISTTDIFEFSFVNNTNGACNIGSFLKYYKNFITPISLEVYAKTVRYYDPKVDKVYWYNDSAVGNYSAVFYVLDEITISDISFNVVYSSTYLNEYLNVSLVHVQIPSTFLKDYNLILINFIWLFNSIMNGFSTIHFN